MEYLTSWKEIANYLHSGVRTVQRYESESGFPVHRLTSNGRGAVIATTTEIDVWMAAFSVRHKSKVRDINEKVRSRPEARLEQGISRMIALQKETQSLQLENISARSILREQLAKLRILTAA